MTIAPHRAVLADGACGVPAAAADIPRPPGIMGRVWGQLLRGLGIGPAHQKIEQEASPASSAATWTGPLAINAGVAMLVAAHAANASRAGSEWARAEFYLGIALFFLPVVARQALPQVGRTERFAGLIIVTLGLFMLRVIRAPQYLLGHDEYLHWVTAQNIVENHHLFTPNILFPIGPLFPGLEIAVTALAELAGLPIFVAALLVLAVARLLFVSTLFLVYERITGSARVAALGSLFYMGCSTFVFFDTNFAYESLALPLLMLTLLLCLRMAEPRDRPVSARPLLVPLAIALVALAMTHHVTAYALAMILFAAVCLDAVGRGARSVGWPLALAMFGGLFVAAAWSWAMGNPGGAYLGPVFENGAREVLQLLHSSSKGSRKLFTADDGTVAPAWERFTTLGSVALICIMLSLGVFRSLCWAGVPVARGAGIHGWRSILRWTNSKLVLLTLMTFAYPLSIVFRLTRSGWEIGNRIGPYAFLGVGVVSGVVVVNLLQGESRSVVRAAAVGMVATLILAGGIISSEGPRILVPAKYQVSADAASIEPMGVDAAIWTKQWLGPGRRFAADRVNRLLLSGYGRQLVSTTLQHGYDAGVILVADKLGPGEIDVLQKLRLDYLFVDLRLTTGLPVVGAYFDGAAADRMASPPTARALLKFDSIRPVSRLFDNGYTIVYDVRALSGRQ